MDSSLTVIGLGNPGIRYAETRHNLGFWVIDLLSRRYRGRWKQPSELRLESRITLGGNPVVLVEPLTYMNLSGDAVAELDADPAALLVVCDDLALPLGRLRLRTKGSDGGHNGLRSITEQLGTSGFARLRLGIGPLPEDADQADFVLTGFRPRDRKIADSMAARAADCVESCLRDGFDAAMSRFNAREEDRESG
jgi:PTH1 family peptidyl-tRNA hydrolase